MSNCPSGPRRVSERNRRGVHWAILMARRFQPAGEIQVAFFGADAGVGGAVFVVGEDFRAVEPDRAGRRCRRGGGARLAARLAR